MYDPSVPAAQVKRERATPLSAEERRLAIIESVIPLLIDQGPSVTTRQIAEAAGVAEGTLFRVFPDKRTLLLAVAEYLVDPDRGEQALVASLEPASDLASKVEAVIDHLRDRMGNVTLVIMALRHAVIGEDAVEGSHMGPPAFLAESNQRLIEAIATHVFAPHQPELRIQPSQAALILRTQVFGMWHPGIGHETPMTPADLSDVLLEGMAR